MRSLWLEFFDDPGSWLIIFALVGVVFAIIIMGVQAESRCEQSWDTARTTADSVRALAECGRFHR